MTGLLVIIIVVVILYVVISRQPDEFSASRSTNINASPAKVFEQLNCQKNFNNWSPWAKLDPNCNTTFSGPDSGVGSCIEWNGNGKVGAGKMTIVESKPNELVKNELQFYKPMKATNSGIFELKEVEGTTQLTWSMVGRSNFIAKAMSLVMNCEKMIGKNFEDGFKNLKEIVEK